MATATKEQPITSVSEDPRYVEASALAKRHREAKKRIEKRRAEISRAYKVGAPRGLDMEAILDGEPQPDPVNRVGLQEEFNQSERELKALQPELEKAEKREKNAQRHAAGLVARSYEAACLERAKKFVKLLGELYVLELEQYEMVGHIKAEGDLVALPHWFGPLPDFQRRWIVAQCARMYKKYGVAIPKVLRDDPFAVDLLAQPYGVKVK